MPRERIEGTAAEPAEPWRSFLSDLDAALKGLVLTKLERNAERDREDVLRLAQAGRLDPRVLKDRYLSLYDEPSPFLRH